MIDTINFRLNNVTKYPIIKTQYERTSRTGETVINIDEDTGEIATNSKIRAILHHDSDNIIALSKRSKLFIASSHYNVSYFYNISQHFIDFNLSVPKYKYGTNILQFIEYFNQDCDKVYDMLVDFVRGFAQKHFFEAIDFKDLELTRIDLCYNQFFNSKYDAMTYLQEQKELLKKYARSTKNDYRSYETSLLYVTKRYSFKIYHKGTEFKKHDKRELQKKNPTNHTLDELQDISDKILRYEVTFRKAQIDYLFEQAELHTAYLAFLKNEATRKSLRLLNKDFYNRGIEFAQQSKRYVFETITQHEAIQTQMVSFDRLIFREVYNFFWDTVKKYQLTQRLSVYDVLQKIDAKNEERDMLKGMRIRQKNSFNKPMVTVLALLNQNYNLEELRKSGLFTKTTYYRYKKQLNELGINTEARLTDMPPPSLDYIDYKYYFGRYHLK